MTSDQATAIGAALPGRRDRRPAAAARAFTATRRFCVRKPLGAFGAAIVLVLVACSAFSPVLHRYGPEQTFEHANPFYDPNSFQPRALQPVVRDTLAGPSGQHWFGTDNFSRDSYARVVDGTRRSLGLGVGSLAIGTLLGLTIGLISAYFGGRVDTVIQRVMDALQAFPPLLFLLLLITLKAPSVKLVMIGIAIVATPSISRIVRGAVLQTRQLPFVEAARVVGATDARVMARHIFPNILPAAIVVFTIGVGSAILAEAALSFLGLAPPGVSWGNGLQIGLAFQRSSPWMAVFNGAAISLAVLGFNLAGDALRDVLDPRLRS
jgi:peptide/nickel transport system permease protein